MLRAAPGLIYCAVSGTATPPYAERGFDLIAQGFGGLIRSPATAAAAKVGPPVSTSTRILAALGITAAWAHKLRTARAGGRTSLMEAPAADLLARLGCTSPPASRGDRSAHILAAPYQAFHRRRLD